MTDAILEAAARAFAECGFYENEAIAAARTMITVAAPLIRAEALEEAAKVAENQPSAPRKIGAPQTWMKQQIAAAIRALKEQP